MLYIKKTDKPNLLERLFNIVYLKDKTISIPITENTKQKKVEKLAIKTLKAIQKNSNSKKIILSKEMQKEEVFINYLNTYGLEIQDGKWLFEVLLQEILEYIIEKKEIEKPSISILINDLNEIEYENIMAFAKKYQTINIVTNHIEKFKNLRKSLEEEGIIITLTNNKKKSLMKSNIIINVDFPQGLFDKYSIREDCILINIKQNIKIKKKKFEGIIINDYEINFKDCELIKENFGNEFCFKDIYEGEFYRRQTVSDIRKKVLRDKVIVNRLKYV